MPKKRRKRKLKRETGLTRRARYHLLTGMNWGTLLDGEEPPDEERLRELWEEHRDELIDYWRLRPLLVKAFYGDDAYPEPKGPGHRPWAWWEWDAPEPKQPVAHKREFERPSVGYPYDHRGAVIGIGEPILELEEDYLARLDLLTDEEREWLATHETADKRYRNRSLESHERREELATPEELEKYSKTEE